MTTAETLRTWRERLEALKAKDHRIVDTLEENRRQLREAELFVKHLEDEADDLKRMESHIL